MVGDDLRRDISELGLEFVRINNGSSNKVARASTHRRYSLCEQSARAGFSRRQGCSTHLQVIADDLFERLAMIRINEITQFPFHDFGHFVDPRLRRLQTLRLSLEL